jgi:hypothetical protein
VIVAGGICIGLGLGWGLEAFFVTKLQDLPAWGPGRIGSEEYKRGAERNLRSMRRTAAFFRKSSWVVCPAFGIAATLLIVIGST